MTKKRTKHRPARTPLSILDVYKEERFLKDLIAAGRSARLVAAYEMFPEIGDYSFGELYDKYFSEIYNPKLTSEPIPEKSEPIPEKKKRARGRQSEQHISFINTRDFDEEQVKEVILSMIKSCNSETDKSRILVAALDTGLLLKIPTQPERIQRFLDFDISRRALSPTPLSYCGDKWEKIRNEEHSLYAYAMQNLQDWVANH